ncbi:MAG: WYL domain-containing protein, partial [Oscillochloridaceae bacterium umkhey_bin13]
PLVRPVRPLRLERHATWWYLHAYCLQARAERCFRLDRLQALHPVLTRPMAVSHPPAPTIHPAPPSPGSSPPAHGMTRRGQTTARADASAPGSFFKVPEVEAVGRLGGQIWLE